MALTRMFWLVSGTIPRAEGSEPVVLYAELPELAIGAALQRGKAMEPVHAWPISALRARPPLVVGAGEAWICGSRSGSAAAFLDAARRAIGHVQLDAAAALLDDALGAALCQPFDATAAFEIWFLQGIVAVYRQDEAAARRAFRNARIADPSKSWDEAFADGRSLFEEALPGPGHLRLTVLPAPERLTVDGAQVEGDPLLAPGSHLLEIGHPPITVRVDLEDRGNATLFVPSLLPDALLSWPADPARWRDLELVLSELPGAPSAIGLYDAPDLWWAPGPRGPFERLPPPPEPVKRGPLPAWAKVLGGVGLVGAASAVVCTVGAVESAREARGNKTGEHERFARPLDRHYRWTLCLAASDAVAVVGLGSALSGALWGRKSR